MSYTMSVDRVIQLARCNDFPEATIRQMFAEYNATELPLPVLATLPIPLPVKVFLGLQDEFFTAQEFRELALAFAKRATQDNPKVESDFFVGKTLEAYEHVVQATRAPTLNATLDSQLTQLVTGYRGAVKALMEPLSKALKNTETDVLKTVAAYEAVWFAGYESQGIACRNAASCAVASVAKPQADGVLQWILDNAVAVTQARAA
ncbi:MAG: hypothetical protein ACN6QH_10395 [Pseudomonas sp.]|uniref:hypothetical protein n=1 Tax=Pseudomonas sp. TaxID=306 RepID=UPI003D1131C9